MTFERNILIMTELNLNLNANNSGRYGQYGGLFWDGM